PLEQIVHAEEEIVPGEEPGVVVKGRADSGQPELIQREACRDGSPRMRRMDNPKPPHDGPRPCRHLVEQVEGQQHGLGRNTGTVLPRIKVEEAEVDLDVAVGGLYAAESENALAE